METRWHEPGRGFFTVPAGTEGELIDDLVAYGVPARERYALDATRRRWRGVFVWLADGPRILQPKEFDFVYKARRRTPMAAVSQHSHRHGD